MDVRNKKGNSSLWLAANGGHLDVVQLLYSAGADIDSQDNRKVSEKIKEATCNDIFAFFPRFITFEPRP